MVHDTSPLAQSPTADFRSDINGLRALSVAFVVFFHVGVRGSDGGFVGVDIFFVISGYLMTKIVLEGLIANNFSYWRFLRARIARIWPAMAAMVLTLLVLGAWLLPPSDLLQMANQSGWALIFWSNQIFHDRAGYATGGADGNWFLHTWSLSVEWQFYLLYPLMLTALAALARRFGGAGPSRPRLALRACLIALFAASLACYLVQSVTAPNSAFFLLPARTWEMIAGGLVHAFADQRTVVRSRVRTLASYSGVATIVLSVLWLGYRHTDPVGVGWPSTLPVAGAAIVLWSSSPDNRVLNNRLARTIGRWSYSIYLWHWPLIVACAMDAVLLRHPYVGKALVVAGSVVLGGLSFVLVESRTRRTGRLAVAKPALLLASAGLAATVVATTGGLAFRMPREADAPAVTQALESNYFPAACSNYQKGGRDLRPCTIDRNSARAVLVIGDSLAEHLYPWFKNHSQVTVDFMTEAECPPVPQFERLQAGFHCLDYAREAWREAALSRYDTVILSANWGLVGGVGPTYCHAEPNGSCRTVRDSERQELVLSELRGAIRALLVEGKTVVVLEGTPKTDISVPQRLERERYWFGQPRMTISLASVIKDNAWIDPMFAEFKSQPGYHLVSLRPALCDSRDCKVYDKQLKRPIYVDERHFDPVWIAQRGDIFAPFVQPQAPH